MYTVLDKWVKDCDFEAEKYLSYKLNDIKPVCDVYY